MLQLIGPRIKEAREEINMSQRDLGMSLGLSDKAVSAYEAARTIPPLETLVRIADELNKPLDYFINPNSPDYTVETKLSVIARNIKKMTTEIKNLEKVVKELENDKEKENRKEEGPTETTQNSANPESAPHKEDTAKEDTPAQDTPPQK